MEPPMQGLTPSSIDERSAHFGNLESQDLEESPSKMFNRRCTHTKSELEVFAESIEKPKSYNSIPRRGSSMWKVNHQNEIFQTRWPCNFFQTLGVFIMTIPASLLMIFSLVLSIPLHLCLNVIDYIFMGTDHLRCKIEPTQSTYALITGASSGLGTDFCHLLAKKGFNLIIVARREDRLAEIKKEMEEKYKIHVIVICQDLGDGASALNMYMKVQIANTDHFNSTKIMPEVVLLINNAGIACVDPFVCVPMEKIENLLNLNNAAVVGNTRLYLRDMIDMGRGAILNVASIAGAGPQPGNSIYGASKAFVRSFSMSLNYELRHTNVTVSCLSPGAFRSEFADKAVKGKGNQSILYTWPVPGMCSSSLMVANAGISGLWAGKAEIVPGFFYKLLMALVPYLSNNVLNWCSVLLWSQPSKITGKELNNAAEKSMYNFK